MSSERHTTDALLKQKEAHDELINRLKDVIRDQDGELNFVAETAMAPHYFFTENPSLIPRYVEFVYKHEYIENKNRRDAVASFHDDTFDLSTLPCTGDDFSPWEKK